MRSWAVVLIGLGDPGAGWVNTRRLRFARTPVPIMAVGMGVFVGRFSIGRPATWICLLLIRAMSTKSFLPMALVILIRASAKIIGFDSRPWRP